MDKLPKLPYGQGSFFKNRNTIGFRKSFVTPDGKTIKKTVYGKTVNECYKKMKEVERELEKGVSSSKNLLYDEISSWLLLIKQPQLKPQSFNRLKTTVENQILKSDLSHMRYQMIKSTDIQNLIFELNNANYSYSTIKKTYDCLNDFFRYVSARDKIDNPMLLVIMPTQKNVSAQTKEIVWFEKNDINLFVTECKHKYPNGKPFYRFSLVFAANIYMGLRIGELIALQWKDIDFERNTVYVSKTWIEYDNPNYNPDDPESTKKIREIQNSNKTSNNRYVPLIPQAKELLMEYRLQCEYNEPTDFVLSTHNRKFTDISQCNKTIANIQRNAGTKVQGASSHTLRHTCASLLFRANNPIEIICQILGNSREVCEKTYVHFVEEQIREAANRVAENLKVNF